MTMSKDEKISITLPERNIECIELNLQIRDSTIVSFFKRFNESEWYEKAIEALKVGIIAIQSASPTLDTQVVHEKFLELENRLKSFMESFQTDIGTNLATYFDMTKGQIPSSLERLFGEDGRISTVLATYFNARDGKVARLIQDYVGPSSEFAKMIDPSNKTSVLSKLETIVKTYLEEEIGKLAKQFSLDDTNSGMSRIKAALSTEILRVEKSNQEFFLELRGALGKEAGKREEAEKGTEKGREFEVALYQQLAEIVRSLDDSSENVRGTVGYVPRCKTGDYIITLSETSGAPGTRIVFEAKKEAGYKLRDALEEIKAAKSNREASIGIMVFARGYEPPEIGDFKRVGEDFFCTVDENNIALGEQLIFLEASYKIARSMIVSSFRKEVRSEIDLVKVRHEIDGLIEEISHLSEVVKKAKTIKSHGEYIEQTVSEFINDLDGKLKEILKSLDL